MAATNTNYREMVQDALKNQKEGTASFGDIKNYIFSNFHVKRGFGNWVEQILKQMVEKGEVKQQDDEYSLNKIQSSGKKTSLEVCGLRRRRRKYKSRRRSRSRRRRRRRSRSRRRRGRRRRRRSRSRRRRSASRVRRRRRARAGRRRRKYSRRGRRSGRRRYRRRRSSRRRRFRRAACGTTDVSKKNISQLKERKAAQKAKKKIQIKA